MEWMATSYFSKVLSWLVPRLSKRKDMEQFQESSGSLKEEMKIFHIVCVQA